MKLIVAPALMTLALALASFAARADLPALVKEERSYRYLHLVAHTAILKSQLAARLNKYTFVFVGGFLNEAQPTYFTKNIEALRELGADSVAAYMPDSRKSVVAISSELERLVARYYGVGIDAKFTGQQRPVILIGHSKGGAEIVMTAINNPGLVVGDMLHAVVAIQGAMSSPIVDFIDAACGTPASPCYLFKWWLDDAVQAMRPSVADPIWADALKRLDRTGQRAAVSRAIHYVRASQTVKLSPLGFITYESVAPGLAGTQVAMAAKYGANDGLVLLSKQRLAAIGSDLGGGTLDADHADLVIHANPLVYVEEPTLGLINDRYRAADIKGFTRAMIRALFK